MVTYYFKLKTLSPVFIGGKQGSDLNKWKFFKSGSSIYVIDEFKLATSLKETNNIENFFYFIKENSRTSLQNFLEIHAWLGKNKSDFAKYFFNSDNANFPSSSLVKTCIKDAFLTPYIPGSSIKGFVRTAILYDFLYSIKNTNNDEFVNLVKKSLKDAENKTADDKIIAETLSALAKQTDEGDNEKHDQSYIAGTVSDLKKESRKEEESYWDILKAIKIGDAYPQDKNISNIIKGYNAKVFGSHDISIALEGIKEGIEFTFTIQIDDFIIKRFKDKLEEKRKNIKNEVISNYLDKIDEKFELENLLKICSNFSSKIVDKEREYSSTDRNYTEITKFYDKIKNNSNIIRIGYGSGLISTTIYLLMTSDQVEEVRKKFFKRSEPKNFPKTRRYIVNDKGIPYLPFGWCSIEGVKNEREK